MLPLNRKERDLASHQLQGLSESSHNLLRCSACGEDLLDVMVVDPDLRYPDGSPVEFYYQVECPFCGDHSFSQKIVGQVYIGNDPCERINYDGADMEGDNVKLKTSLKRREGRG